MKAYPKAIREKLLYLRELIFSVANSSETIGEIEETTKWGEPSYITSQTKSGTTIRIDWKENTPDHYYMFLNCKTSLIEDFKMIYGDLFKYGGNRSLVFHKDDPFHKEEVKRCITMALTYKTTRKGL